MSPPNVVYLWPGRFLMRASAVRNRLHRHLAASILIGLEQPFRLGLGRKTLREVRGALVAPNTLQSLDSRGGAMLVAHVDPDQPAYRRFAQRLCDADCAVLDDAEVRKVLTALARALGQAAAPGAGEQLFESLLTIAAAGCAPLPLDPRIAALAARLRSAPPESLAPAKLAAELGLSESRLMHLFKAELGVPLTRFVLSLKLQQAMLGWQPGMTLADLAADAGFYDQPHLVRTARAMLDALPSQLTDVRQLQIVRCGSAE